MSAVNYLRCPIVAVEVEDGWIWTTPDGVFRIVERGPGGCVLDELLYSRYLKGHEWHTMVRHFDPKHLALFINVILYPPGSEPSPEYAGLGSNPRADIPDDGFIDMPEGARHD